MVGCRWDGTRRGFEGFVGFGREGTIIDKVHPWRIGFPVLMTPQGESCPHPFLIHPPLLHVIMHKVSVS